MSAHLLIIDHELEHLERYRNALSSKNSTWTMAFCSSEEDALESCETSAPDIIVASLGFQGGNGLQLLSRLVDRAPMAHAFIAASESEKEQLTSALEGGCRYLPRPCPQDRLHFEFQKCLAIDSWLENPVVKEVVSSRTAFETLPPLYLKVVAALNAPHADTSSIADSISSNLALSSKILETVNSSHFGFDQKVSDIPHAISILGFETVKTIVLAAQVFDRQAHSPRHKALLNELWHHSIEVATAARRISLFETDNPASAEEAYTAGLLHDIGKLVLLDLDTEAFDEAQRLAREESIPPWQAEARAIGCDHAEVGAYLLARWGLSESLCETAALHHRPANSCRESFSSLAAVHAANAIVRKRRNPHHVDAAPNQGFLEEIGKVGRWEAWQAVAIGEPPPRPKAKLVRQPPDQAVEPKPAATHLTPPAPDPVTHAAHAALSEAVARAALRKVEEERLESAQSYGKNILFAFAAGVLVSLICIYFINTFSKTDQRDASQALAGSESSDPEETAGLAKSVSRGKLVEEILEMGQSLDAEAIEEPPPPVEPPPPPPPPFPEIRLGAIFFRANDPKAQVNNRIVGIGDRLDEARIVGIERTSISVEHYGRVRVIDLD
ncbi:HDOD domain-containing protein [Pelagicoccus sp. SDUM812003]|uniref:response regulator n=1 Tax=Pelagicoccus sp. SDUM812003 TaxID=3041267 RepID=UPI00280EF7A3|nr:HDOD domain-containing protein [Pelagicoccus sp. SDUM812003]MDQ8201772.1 HDOD domain-containing protein [Pelagicoccus sp. SDUM812003]